MASSGLTAFVSDTRPPQRGHGVVGVEARSVPAERGR